ncbi:MAG: hypothetical protein KJ017_00180 [Alphaproteobacteria bacterium]|nr:hypothetical protein [Alphaproteobacteria bacterium]
MKATLTIAGMAALALLVFGLWGLRGSLVLIGLWFVAYLGFSLWYRRARRLIRKRFGQMTARQRAQALSALSEEDRAEVLAAIKNNERAL